ncbi:MAG: glycoside hydrolase family 3 protein [Treponema sp.]|nr:glycoside hydrolase family 3 protein [Treponema sp.]
MALREKISQMLLVNIEGKDKFIPINDFKKGGDKKILPGGYLLFSFNIAETKTKTKNFLQTVKEAHLEKTTIAPYFSIDHEGGYVNRLKNFSTVPLFSPEKIAKQFSKEEAFKIYKNEAKLLKELGIHINFAPIVEIKTAANSSFIEDRSFGSLNDVLNYASTQVLAFNSEGVYSVLKHFPGNSADDPHVKKCILDVDEKYFNEVLIPPFKNIILTNPAGILISHVMIPSIDLEPSCFSKIIITDILRNRLKFSRIIFSDDIYMASFIEIKSGSENVTDKEAAISATKAIKAGINVIMSSEKKYLNLVEEIAKLTINDDILKNKINESVKIILREKEKLGLVKIF